MMKLLPPPGSYLFACVRLLVSLSAYYILHKKTTLPISTKLGWRMGLGPEQTPLTSDVDLDKGEGSRIFLSLGWRQTAA